MVDAATAWAIDRQIVALVFLFEACVLVLGGLVGAMLADYLHVRERRREAAKSTSKAPPSVC